MKRLSVICMIIVVPALTTFSQRPGSTIFGFQGIHDVYLTFNQPDYWDSLIFYKEQGQITGEYTYMPATVIFDGTTLDSTGVRLKGNSSFNASGIKKSIKLKFNEFVSGQKLDGLKKVNLNNNFNDPTLMREKLFLDVLENSRVYAPRCTYARVYINEEYRGLYTLVDHIDKVFLLSNFYDKSGNLYKGDKDPWMPCANLSYHADPQEYRDCYTLKTNEEKDDWSDLENFIYKINNTPPPLYYETLNSVLNTESFINAWATNIVFVNVDSYVETGHNYYIYHNPLTDKFEWITWDVNEAIGLWNCCMPLDQLYNLGIFHLPPEAELVRPLSFYMLEDPVLRNLYVHRVYEIVCRHLRPERLFQKIDELYDLIRDDVYADTNKLFSNLDFENNINEDVYLGEYPGWVPGLKSFIQHRHNLLVEQLGSLGYDFSCFVGFSPPGQEDINFFPNPAGDYLCLETGYQYKGQLILEIRNTEGQLVLSKHVNDPAEHIRVSGLSGGIYFIRLISESGCRTGKLIKR